MVWLPDYRNPAFVGISDTDLRAKADDLHKRFRKLRDDPEFDGHGGSPGEWMHETIGEIETELQRRATAPVI